MSPIITLNQTSQAKHSLSTKASKGHVYQPDPQLLIFEFGRPHHCLSHAVLGGGISKKRGAIWYQVRDSDLSLGQDPLLWLRRKLANRHYEDNYIGLMTSANIARFIFICQEHSGLQVDCLATVGLSNACRIGSPTHSKAPCGTINLVCRINAPLTQAAQVEALAMIAEAKCAAVMNAGVQSRLNQIEPCRDSRLNLATGTGTDCHTIASRHAPDAPHYPYAGKHTKLGELIGSTCYEAVYKGCQQWLSAMEES